MNPSRPATIDPHKALSQVRQFDVTNLFGNPAVIRNLSSLSERPGLPRPSDPAGINPAAHQEGPAAHPEMQTLKRVISAGAPASVSVIEQFTQLLPSGVQVFTPYGATEALPVANIGSDEILSETRHLTEQGKGVCVGRPVKGMTVHVIRISDDAIPEWSDTLCVPPGVVGEFVVRGPVVTKRYFRRDEATKLAKIHDPHTGEVLHRMGDVGYIDDAGRMWFCGRKSHRVETPHGPLFTDMVEPVFNTPMTRTALVGVKRDGVVTPVLCVEHNLPNGVKWRLRAWSEVQADYRKTAEGFEHTRMIETFLRYDGPFPVDVRHNSKIFREKLAVWADKKLGSAWKGGPV
jgi:acyl-CoA synthetase (AMP-forming)/AMP-acid ligase II